MDEQTDVKRVWIFILICFALTVLSCSVKHYLVCVVSATASCPYLCPSAFNRSLLGLPDFLEKIYAAQSWLVLAGQDLFGVTGGYHKQILSSIVIAPLIEEVFYRGPLYLVRDRLGAGAWWWLASFLVFLFSLSHSARGLSLFPFIILGLLSSWLIIKTRRFWPCLVLHVLYNFQAVSYPYYRAFFSGD